MKRTGNNDKKKEEEEGTILHEFDLI